MNRFGDYEGDEIFPTEGIKKLAKPVTQRGYRTRPNLGSIEHYVWRMLKSAAKRPSLTIQCSKHDEKPSLHLFVARESVMVMIFLKRADIQREQVVRAVFAQAGVAPVHDEVTGQAEDESQFLLYALQKPAHEVTHLVAEVFRKGYGLAENAEMEFNYREREAA